MANTQRGYGNLPRRRVIFEREQGPPWQDVLTQMIEEQNSILEDN